MTQRPLSCLSRFGAGFRALTKSWMPDLAAALDTGWPAVFTCANDYSDLAGETAIFEEVLPAQFVLTPRVSPFKAITVVRQVSST